MDSVQPTNEKRSHATPFSQLVDLIKFITGIEIAMEDQVIPVLQQHIITAYPKFAEYGLVPDASLLIDIVAGLDSRFPDDIIPAHLFPGVNQILKSAVREELDLKDSEAVLVQTTVIDYIEASLMVTGRSVKVNMTDKICTIFVGNKMVMTMGPFFYMEDGSLRFEIIFYGVPGINSMLQIFPTWLVELVVGYRAGHDGKTYVIRTQSLDKRQIVNICTTEAFHRFITDDEFVNQLVRSESAPLPGNLSMRVRNIGQDIHRDIAQKGQGVQ